MRTIVFIGLLAIACLGTGAAGEPLDTLVLGVPASEEAHALMVTGSEVVSGTLGEPGRVLLPPKTEHWEGGRLAFTLKVDPERQTYLTVRFSGDDVTVNRLVLFCEGKQVGYRHLGDIDILDTGSVEPACPGRFFYTTTPLPVALTKGRSDLHCEIRSSGRIWGYGTSFEQYQKPMTEPSRRLYRVYTHRDGYFVPPVDERQGLALMDPPVRRAPGPEVLDQVKARIEKDLKGMLSAKPPPGQQQMHFLARAWWVGWTSAAKNPAVVTQVAAGVDRLCERFREDPKLVRSDPGVYNSDWFATGMAGDAVRLLAEPLKPLLDQQLAGVGKSRREAWTELFVDGRDWLRRHRRLYTNQSMIVDLNLYRMNRALAAIAPRQALPEAEALRYLHESIGLRPWLGSDTDGGSEKPVGDNYLQLTAKGLTRELGYVGYYGEVLDWVTQIYDATREPGKPGDPAIRKQLAKVAAARAIFRHPAVDEEGNRAMRIEAVIGWRDDHHPGDVTYGERPTWDASALYTAAALPDDWHELGHAQQMFADNQFFASVADQLRVGGLRITAGLLGVPEQYAAISAAPPSAQRLPMSRGQPDLVFTDEEDGVVAVKRGEEILYVSLYWRARHAVNFLARIHHLTPHFDRIAVVRQEVRFTPSGQTWKRPDWTNFGFANGGHRYPDLHSANAGEELPIALVPAGIAFKPGQENVHAGKGSFYLLRHGDWLIAMNTTTDTPQRFDWPAGVPATLDLVSNRMLAADQDGGVVVGPRRTVVLHLGR